MGTRGAIGYFGKLDGKNLHKVTYNHFDSYPNYLGMKVVEYIQNRDFDLGSIKNDFKKIELVNEDTKPTKEQIERCYDVDSVNLSVSEQSEDDWYCLLRDSQGDLDSYSKVGFMIDSEYFLHDSLFCEWAYIINCNTGKLEIYRGFQESKPKGRYRDIEPDRGYYGVSLIKSVPLEDVTEEMMGKLEEEVYEVS